MKTRDKISYILIGLTIGMVFSFTLVQINKETHWFELNPCQCKPESQDDA